MSSYALIEKESGVVANYIMLDDEAAWLAPDGFFIVQTDSASIGWTYIDGVFNAPSPVPLTPEEIIRRNQGEMEQRQAFASQSMAPVLLSLQLGDASDEEVATAKSWQAYYRALTALDVSVESPDWPAPPSV